MFVCNLTSNIRVRVQFDVHSTNTCPCNFWAGASAGSRAVTQTHTLLIYLIYRRSRYRIWRRRYQSGVADIWYQGSDRSVFWIYNQNVLIFWVTTDTRNSYLLEPLNFSQSPCRMTDQLSNNKAICEGNESALEGWGIYWYFLIMRVYILEYTCNP